MIILAILIPTIIGYLVLSLLLREKQNIISLAEKLALSFMFGSSLITIQMFIYSFFGIHFGFFVIALPWILLMPALFFSKERFTINKPKLSQVEWLLSILIGFKIIYVFFEALIKPVVGYDAIWNFSLRSKILFFENIVPLLKSHPYFLGAGFTNYPLHLPLLETWTYLAMNKWDDVSMKIIFPIYFLILLVIFYKSLRDEKSRVQSLFFTFLLSSLPMLTYHATIEYADFIVGVYFFSAVVYLYKFTKIKDIRFLILSSVLAGMSAWVKDEGVIFYLICLLAILFYNKFKSLRFSLLYLIPLFVLIGPWIIIKRMLGLNFGNQITFSMSAINQFLTFKPEVLIRIFNKTFLNGNWHLLPLALIVLIIFYYKEIFNTNKRYIFYCFIFAWGFFMALYIFTPNNAGMILSDIILSRNYLTYFPIALYLIGQTFSPTPRE